MSFASPGSNSIIRTVTQCYMIEKGSVVATKLNSRIGYHFIMRGPIREGAENMKETTYIGARMDIFFLALALH